MSKYLDNIKKVIDTAVKAGIFINTEAVSEINAAYYYLVALEQDREKVDRINRDLTRQIYELKGEPYPGDNSERPIPPKSKDPSYMEIFTSLVDDK